MGGQWDGAYWVGLYLIVEPGKNQGGQPTLSDRAKNLKCLKSAYLVLILLGKDSGSCRHACPYCEDGAPWNTPSRLNTLGSLLSWHEVVQSLKKRQLANFQLWVADGCRDSRSKNFQNMRHVPLIKGDPDMLILSHIAIPELHLVLGRDIMFHLG